MGYMKMTNDRAEKIATAITKKALEQEYLTQAEREKICPDLLYTIYRAYVEEKLPGLNNLDKEFLSVHTNHRFYYQYVGDVEVSQKTYDVQVTFDQELPVPHDWRPTIKTAHPSFVAYDTIMQARVELQKRAQEMAHDVKKNALSVTTVDKLVKVWPEAAALICMATGYQQPTATPYVPLSELMAKYARALPAPTAANDGTVEVDE